MSREEPPGPAETPGDQDTGSLNAEELEKLTAEADDRPEEVTALVKKLVLETIDEVRRTIREGGTAQD